MQWIVSENQAPAGSMLTQQRDKCIKCMCESGEPLQNCSVNTQTVLAFIESCFFCLFVFLYCQNSEVAKPKFKYLGQALPDIRAAATAQSAALILLPILSLALTRELLHHLWLLIWEEHQYYIRCMCELHPKPSTFSVFQDEPCLTLP